MPFPFAETLSHLSVKFKLALGFGLVLLLTCIIAATGWQALAASVDRSEKLTSIARLVHLTKDLRAERITYRVLADTTSQANMQTALTNIQLQLDSLSQRMKDPFHLDLARQQRNTLDQFRATLATLAQHHDEGAPMMLTLKQKAGYALVALVRAQTNLLTSAGRNHDDEHWRGPFKQLEQLRRQIDDASVAVQTPAYRFEGLEAYSAFAAAAISRLDNALGEVEVWLSQPPYQADSDLERVKLVLSSYSQHLEDLKAAQLITESAHARMEELGEHLLHTNDALSSSQQEKRDHEALDNRITLLSTTGMALLLGLIAAGLITRQILLPLHQSLRAAQRIASGDLSRDIETSRRDELGQLQRSMQQMVLCLRELMGAIGQSSAQVNDAASQLSTATRQSHLNIRQQREETDQVATAMHEMTATALEVARNAECASEAATEADQHAREGDRVVTEAITQIEQLADEVTRSSQAMGRLKQESEKIGGVLDVIKSVSQQTNLLALNAAIEAARAGEAGRGFSVVADEVRSLAKRTQSSAEEIEALIGGLQQGTQDVARQLDSSLTLTLSSVELSRRTGLALERISGSVSRIQGMNLQIASAGEEQSVVAEQINVSILNVRDMAERAADASEETAAASVELARLGEHLKDSVSHFRL